VILTIDTTVPLNDTDRALLRVLLDGPSSTPAPAHRPAAGPRPNSAEALGTLVAAAAGAGPRRPDDTVAAARMPVAQQPGVTFTESVRQDTESDPQLVHEDASARG
jgi:hypothetical protein